VGVPVKVLVLDSVGELVTVRVLLGVDVVVGVWVFVAVPVKVLVLDSVGVLVTVRVLLGVGVVVGV